MTLLETAELRQDPSDQALLDPAQELPEHSIDLREDTPEDYAGPVAETDYVETMSGAPASTELEDGAVDEQFGVEDYTGTLSREKADTPEVKDEFEQKFDSALHNAITKALRETPIEQMREDQKVDDALFNSISQSLREVDFSNYGHLEQPSELVSEPSATNVEPELKTEPELLQTERVRASVLDRERRSWGDKITSKQRREPEQTQPTEEIATVEITEPTEKQGIRDRVKNRSGGVPAAKLELSNAKNDEEKWARIMEKATDENGELRIPLAKDELKKAREKREAAEELLAELREKRDQDRPELVTKMRNKALNQKERIDAAVTAFRERRVVSKTEAQIRELQEQEDWWTWFSGLSGNEEQDVETLLDIKKKKAELYQVPELQRANATRAERSEGPSYASLGSEPEAPASR